MPEYTLDQLREATDSALEKALRGLERNISNQGILGWNVEVLGSLLSTANGRQRGSPELMRLSMNVLGLALEKANHMSDQQFSTADHGRLVAQLLELTRDGRGHSMI